MSRALIWPAVAAIRTYQFLVSPWMPNICRFDPSCSHYSLGCYRTHGLWKGTWLTVWRLMRCQPFSRGGFDPVPGSDCPELRKPIDSSGGGENPA